MIKGVKRNPARGDFGLFLSKIIIIIHHIITPVMQSFRHFILRERD